VRVHEPVDGTVWIAVPVGERMMLQVVGGPLDSRPDVFSGRHEVQS
jgi:hypothetical protein